MIWPISSGSSSSSSLSSWREERMKIVCKKYWLESVGRSLEKREDKVFSLLTGIEIDEGETIESYCIDPTTLELIVEICPKSSHRGLFYDVDASCTTATAIISIRNSHPLKRIKR